MGREIQRTVLLKKHPRNTAQEIEEYIRNDTKPLFYYLQHEYKKKDEECKGGWRAPRSPSRERNDTHPCNILPREAQEPITPQYCSCGMQKKPERTNSEEYRERYGNRKEVNYNILGAEIVDQVRNSTGLSHKLSQNATEVALDFIIVSFTVQF